ncbi:hypothetical protein H0H81_008846 [Sphagnurus paluster]|uniref:Uncharacterized protein n=1 Tax=Sphagnurus paluster TaxID=117069 RepID=A0A9P7GPP7_9AGAR|nr:hypothetical protein H0H81_008846 [Sphagnurus paluster]
MKSFFQRIQESHSGTRRTPTVSNAAYQVWVPPSKVTAEPSHQHQPIDYGDSPPTTRKAGGQRSSSRGDQPTGPHFTPQVHGDYNHATAPSIGRPSHSTSRPQTGKSSTLPPRSYPHPTTQIPSSSRHPDNPAIHSDSNRPPVVVPPRAPDIRVSPSQHASTSRVDDKHSQNKQANDQSSKITETGRERRQPRAKQQDKDAFRDRTEDARYPVLDSGNSRRKVATREKESEREKQREKPKEKDRSQERERDKDRERPRGGEKERDRERVEQGREKDRLRDRERNKDRVRDTDPERDRVRVRDRHQRDRSRERGQMWDREQARDKEQARERDRIRGRERERDKQRDKERERERIRETEREKVREQHRESNKVQERPDDSYRPKETGNETVLFHDETKSRVVERDRGVANERNREPDGAPGLRKARENLHTQQQFAEREKEHRRVKEKDMDLRTNKDREGGVDPDAPDRRNKTNPTQSRDRHRDKRNHVNRQREPSTDVQWHSVGLHRPPSARPQVGAHAKEGALDLTAIQQPADVFLSNAADPTVPHLHEPTPSPNEKQLTNVNMTPHAVSSHFPTKVSILQVSREQNPAVNLTVPGLLSSQAEPTTLRESRLLSAGRTTGTLKDTYDRTTNISGDSKGREAPKGLPSLLPPPQNAATGPFKIGERITPQHTTAAARYPSASQQGVTYQAKFAPLNMEVTAKHSRDNSPLTSKPANQTGSSGSLPLSVTQRDSRSRLPAGPPPPISNVEVSTAQDKQSRPNGMAPIHLEDLPTGNHPHYTKKSAQHVLPPQTQASTKFYENTSAATDLGPRDRVLGSMLAESLETSQTQPLAISRNRPDPSNPITSKDSGGFRASIPVVPYSTNLVNNLIYSARDVAQKADVRPPSRQSYRKIVTTADEPHLVDHDKLNQASQFDQIARPSWSTVKGSERESTLQVSHATVISNQVSKQEDSNTADLAKPGLSFHYNGKVDVPVMGTPAPQKVTHFGQSAAYYHSSINPKAPQAIMGAQAHTSRVHEPDNPGPLKSGSPGSASHPHSEAALATAKTEPRQSRVPELSQTSQTHPAQPTERRTPGTSNNESRVPVPSMNYQHKPIELSDTRRSELVKSRDTVLPTAARTHPLSSQVPVLPDSTSQQAKSTEVTTQTSRTHPKDSTNSRILTSMSVTGQSASYEETNSRVPQSNNAQPSSNIAPRPMEPSAYASSTATVALTARDSEQYFSHRNPSQLIPNMHTLGSRDVPKAHVPNLIADYEARAVAPNSHSRDLNPQNPRPSTELGYRQVSAPHGHSGSVAALFQLPRQVSVDASMHAGSSLQRPVTAMSSRPRVGKSYSLEPLSLPSVSASLQGHPTQGASTPSHDRRAVDHQPSSTYRQHTDISNQSSTKRLTQMHSTARHPTTLTAGLDILSPTVPLTVSTAPPYSTSRDTRTETIATMHPVIAGSRYMDPHNQDQHSQQQTRTQVPNTVVCTKVPDSQLNYHLENNNSLTSPLTIVEHPSQRKTDGQPGQERIRDGKHETETTKSRPVAAPHEYRPPILHAKLADLLSSPDPVGTREISTPAPMSKPTSHPTPSHTTLSTQKGYYSPPKVSEEAETRPVGANLPEQRQAQEADSKRALPSPAGLVTHALPLISHLHNREQSTPSGTNINSHSIYPENAVLHAAPLPTATLVQASSRTKGIDLYISQPPGHLSSLRNQEPSRSSQKHQSTPVSHIPSVQPIQTTTSHPQATSTEATYRNQKIDSSRTRGSGVNTPAASQVDLTSSRNVTPLSQSISTQAPTEHHVSITSSNVPALEPTQSSRIQPATVSTQMSAPKRPEVNQQHTLSYTRIAIEATSSSQAQPPDLIKTGAAPHNSESRISDAVTQSASYPIRPPVETSSARPHPPSLMRTAAPPQNLEIRSDAIPQQHGSSSTRILVSGSGPPPTKRLQKIARTPSEDTIVLKTPSSLTPSMLKPTTSRNSIPASLSSHPESKKRGLFSMFRSKSNQPQAQTEAVQHSLLDRSRKESTTNVEAPTPEKLPLTEKAPLTENSPPDDKVVSSLASRVKPPPPITLPIPINPRSDRKSPNAKVFTPFRYLTSKRNRTMSAASLEAQDGTAPNTVVGSPTASMHSTQPPIHPPPLRDAFVATQEWRKLEAAEVRKAAGGKMRRARPGVVFDVAEDPRDDRKRRPAPRSKPRRPS